MHLDCNRIDMEGNVNDDHDIGIRATMAANEVTRQRGWVQAEQRSDENKERIALDCMNALKTMSRFSWDFYVQKLTAKGYDLKLRYDSNGVVRGYTVRMGNSIYKSSELGKGRNLMPSKNRHGVSCILWFLQRTNLIQDYPTVQDTLLFLSQRCCQKPRNQSIASTK